MKRYKIVRQFSCETVEYVFAEDAGEARRSKPDYVFADPILADGRQLHQTTQRGLPSVRPAMFKDNRHPLLIPLEGKQVLFTDKSGLQSKLWVTPFGEGGLNPLNSTIHSHLSQTRRWNDIYTLGKVDKLKVTPGKITKVEVQP